MSNALLSGVSGLLAHQRMLDVIGNNLANMNTTAYKAQNTLFADVLYTTVRPATSASDTDLGGTNPRQVGSGVSIAQIGRKFSQGNLQPTGGLFDFAIQGQGLFVVSDGTSNLYTRAGAFGLDDTGRLVDPNNGLRVQRLGTVGEADGVNLGIQTPGDTGIVVPLGMTIPGAESGNVLMNGNLNSQAVGPLAEVLSTVNAFLAGGAPATTATALNSLDSNTAAYAAGDFIDISGTNADGSSVSSSFGVTAATTMGDLLAAISGAFSDATATLDSAGSIVLTADNTGEASLTMALADAAGNAGGTAWGNHPFLPVVDGKEGDIVQGGIEVFDVQGGAHMINLTFQKQGDNLWDMTAAIDPTKGSMVDNSINQIRFRDDGSLQQVLGPDQSISFNINGIAATQTVDFSFGSTNSFDGLTQLATESEFSAQQDGFPPGTLAGINVAADGVIEGVATNGRRLPIAQLAIATFRNPHGLLAQGDNTYQQSLNTGEAQIGAALAGKRGSVTGGQLESSNVDISYEFTRLIVAQRGFSANARTITVTDEVLEELTNLIR